MSQYPERVKTILDDPKLRLSADPLPGGTGRPSFTVYWANSDNPRIDVWTNMPNDKDNGRIRADLDLPTFYDFLELVKYVAEHDVPVEEPFVFENSTHPWDKANNRKSKELVVQSRLVVGKDQEGKIYIATTSWEKDRPKIRFYFGTGYFHSLGYPGGKKMSNADVSKFRALSFYNMMSHLMAAVAAKDWEPRPPKDKGNNQSGGGGGYGNRGGGQSQPAQQANYDSAADLPF